MSQDTLTCPHCGYENIVLTCGFCLQCGEDISAPSLADDDAHCPDPSDGARDEGRLAQLITQASTRLAASCRATDRGWKLSIPVSSGRKQTVHVLRGDEAESDESVALVAFLSVCGPVREDLAVRLLEWNSRLVQCAFAIRTIQGQKMIVIGANQPVDTLMLPQVIEALTTIADRGDAVENRIGEGVDRY